MKYYNNETTLTNIVFININKFLKKILYIHRQRGGMVGYASRGSVIVDVKKSIRGTTYQHIHMYIGMSVYIFIYLSVFGEEEVSSQKL